MKGTLMPFSKMTVLAGCVLTIMAANPSPATAANGWLPDVRLHSSGQRILAWGSRYLPYTLGWKATLYAFSLNPYVLAVAAIGTTSYVVYRQVYR